jgi:hypothetical protein
MMQSPDPGLADAEREIERAWFLGAELWSRDGRSDVEELRRLVQDGQERGFLTYDEIVAGLEEVELTTQQIEGLYTYLIDHGIELVEGEQHKHPPHEQPALVAEEKGPKLDSSCRPSRPCRVRRSPRA